MRIPGADKAIDNLIAWSQRDEWAHSREQVLAGHFDDVFERFDITMDGIARKLGEQAIRMVLGCVLEDFFAARFGEDGLNVVDDYLRRRGWKEKVPARRYLEAMRDSRISLYEIVDLVPGKQMTVKDLVLGGDPVAVHEKLGSESANRWDCIAARVVSVNGQAHFTGGMLPFERILANEFLAVLDKMLAAEKRRRRADAKAKGEAATIDDGELRLALLEMASPLFVQMWLTHTLDRASQPMPEVRNADGDEILFAEVRFPIKGSLSEIAGRLDACTELVRDDPEKLLWSWLEAAKAAKPRPSPGNSPDAMTWDTHNDFGKRILGDVTIKERTLVLSVNSMRRAERGRMLLDPVLEGLVGQPMTSVQSLEKVLDERRGMPAPQSPLLPEDAAEVLRAYFDQHYRRTLDEPIPFFDGISPRQAARTKKGKEKVVAWLKHLENGNSRRASSDSQPPYDFSWMWEELGVSGFRK